MAQPALTSYRPAPLAPAPLAPAPLAPGRDIAYGTAIPGRGSDLRDDDPRGGTGRYRTAIESDVPIYPRICALAVRCPRRPNGPRVRVAFPLPVVVPWALPTWTFAPLTAAPASET